MTNRDVSSVPVHPPTVSACRANRQRCPPLPILWPHGMEENEPHSGQTSPEPHHRRRIRAVVSLPAADTQNTDSRVEAVASRSGYVLCTRKWIWLYLLLHVRFNEWNFLISHGLCWKSELLNVHVSPQMLGYTSYRLVSVVFASKFNKRWGTSINAFVTNICVRETRIKTLWITQCLLETRLVHSVIQKKHTIVTVFKIVIHTWCTKWHPKWRI